MDRLRTAALLVARVGEEVGSGMVMTVVGCVFILMVGCMWVLFGSSRQLLLLVMVR